MDPWLTPETHRPRPNSPFLTFGPFLFVLDDESQCQLSSVRLTIADSLVPLVGS